MNEDEVQVREVATMAAQMASAFVRHNPVQAGELPKVIEAVYRSLQGIAEGRTEAPTKAQPAVAIRRSVKPDYIVCLEDGQRYKSLKRRLRTHHGMTPEDYRAKGHLESDYPMVAPRYAAERSKLAKSIGLGKARPRKTDEDTNVV